MNGGMFVRHARIMIKVFDRKDIGQGARSAEMFNILSYRDTSIF
jgi:hypothetical protein